MDAVDDLNGRELCGERVTIEMTRDKDRDRRYDNRRQNRRNPYGPPLQTRYRMSVENLSTRFSWQVGEFVS